MDYNINVISYCFVRHNGVFLIKYIVFMMVLYSKKHKKLENFYKFFDMINKFFKKYRDISIGERNEKETFEYGLGVFTLRSIYLD